KASVWMHVQLQSSDTTGTLVISISDLTSSSEVTLCPSSESVMRNSLGNTTRRNSFRVSVDVKASNSPSSKASSVALVRLRLTQRRIENGSQRWRCSFPKVP